MKRGKTYIINDITIEKVLEELLRFQDRYRYYVAKNTKSTWCFRLISKDNKRCVIQLIDKFFEPSRGNVKSDAPYIYLGLVQNHDDVIIDYSIKWQGWKVWLVFLGTVFYSSVIWTQVYLSDSSDRVQMFASLILWLCMGIMFAYWLIKNIRHDSLTIQVFEELLTKNFSNIVLDN